MSTRERSAIHARLNEGLKSWSSRWALEGLAVLCPACHAGQLAQDGREPFVHLQYCNQQNVFSKYPWLELRGVLRDLAPDPTA